jgi:hypothetical protein
MSIWRLLAGLTAALLLACTTVRADEKLASLDLAPSSIAGRTVSDDEPVFFLVRLKAGSQPLSDIALSTFSNDGIEARLEPPSVAEVATLPANAEQTWKLKVTPVKGGVVAPGALSVQVTVAYKEASGDKLLQRFQFQTLAITAPAAVTVAALADIDFKGSLEALSHERPGQLFVTITNKHSQPLNVTDVKVSTPPFVTATFPTAPFQIPYGGAQVVPVTFQVPDQIVPGKYPIVVVAALKTPGGLPGSATKSQDVEIGVLGESDLLAKIGAPSLLFLPGVLFLLAWQLLWSIGKTAAQRGEYPLVPTSGGFWVVAVAIALIAVYAYPWIAQHTLHQSRDYRVAYGFDDYAYLFALAIGAATACFLAWLGLQWLYAQYKALLLRINTPAATDQPVDVLKKLGRLDLTVQLPRAHPAAGAAGDIVYILDAWREPSLIWIVPPAVLIDGAQADDLSRNLLQDIVAGRIPEARRLVPLLQQGLDARWWSFDWDPVAGIERPRKVTATGWTELPATGRFIRTR